MDDLRRDAGQGCSSVSIRAPAPRSAGKLSRKLLLCARMKTMAAASQLGARLRYWDLPDCIYRQLPGGAWLVNGEEDLWKPVHPLEMPLVERLAAWLDAGSSVQMISWSARSPWATMSIIFLVRAAAERLGRPLWYYPDYPYAVTAARADLAEKTGEGWQKSMLPGLARCAVRLAGGRWQLYLADQHILGRPG